MTAADLAVTRAGASTLGELPLFGLPSILVPYPYAWRYQRVNAQYLVERGAAILVKDEDLPAQILPQVRELIRDRERLGRMQNAMRSLAQPGASTAIAEILVGLARSTRSGRSGGE